MSSRTPVSISDRLPVNPRRHKVPTHQRRRVTTACNSCNTRRTKCSGEKPCAQCRRSGRECLFPQRPETQKAELERLRQRCSLLEACLKESFPDVEDRKALWLRVGGPPDSDQSVDRDDGTQPTHPWSHQSHNFLAPDDADDLTRSSKWPREIEGNQSTPSLAPNDEEYETKTPEGRLLHDPDGTARYLGETSGATFLDYLKEFMIFLVPLAPTEPFSAGTDAGSGSAFVQTLGQYQTHDSRPLYDVDVDPHWLPSRTEMSLKLIRLRHLIQDGNGDFPSGGIYWWGDLDLSLAQRLLDPAQEDGLSSARRLLAFYHAAFAVACQATKSPQQPDLHEGEAHFKSAKLLLGNPLDVMGYTLTDVSTMALMAFYLIEMNRRDAACVYVSMAIQIAIRHGMFRGWVDEQAKRVSWTLYTLDRWLSCLMGRAPVVHEKAIRLALPTETPGLPPAAGLVAHVSLARIADYIVCNTYKIAPWDGTTESGAARYHVGKSMQMLQNWLASLPPSVKLETAVGGGLNPDPAVCTLHMYYYQLILVTARPILFIAAKKAAAERYIGRLQGVWDLDKHPQQQHIKAGLDAARWIMRIARQLDSTRRLMHAELHYTFNAAIVLLLEDLARGGSSDGDDNMPDLDVTLALRLLVDDAETRNDYSRDCSRVLNSMLGLVKHFKTSTRGPGNLIAHGLPMDNAGLGVDEEPREGADFGLSDTLPASNLVPDADASQYIIQEGDGLYRELLSWTSTDDYQLYENFRM